MDLMEVSARTRPASWEASRISSSAKWISGLLRSSPCFKKSFDPLEKYVAVDGFGDKGMSPDHGISAKLGLGNQRCHESDPHGLKGRVSADPFRDLRPIHVRHHDIKKHQFGPRGLDHLESLGRRITNAYRVKPGLFKHHLHQLADIHIIIHEQYCSFWFHAKPPLKRARNCGVILAQLPATTQ